jgi:hypothetical protein
LVRIEVVARGLLQLHDVHQQKKSPRNNTYRRSLDQKQRKLFKLSYSSKSIINAETPQVQLRAAPSPLPSPKPRSTTQTRTVSSSQQTSNSIPATHKLPHNPTSKEPCICPETCCRCQVFAVLHGAVFVPGDGHGHGDSACACADSLAQVE